MTTALDSRLERIAQALEQIAEDLNEINQRLMKWSGYEDQSIEVRVVK